MGKYDDVLPEEKDAHSQPILEDLRRAYRPEMQDARAFTRIREHLLAGDGGQEEAETISFSHMSQRKMSDAKNLQRDHVKTHRRKSWQRVLAMTAAVLVLALLVGSWALTIHLQRTSTGRGYGNPRALSESLIDIHMFGNGIGWALSLNHRTLRTTDGGGNWQEVTPPALLALEKRFGLAGPWAFRDALTAWVAVTVNEQQTPEYHSPTAALLFHTTDGGTTWQKTVVKLSGQSAGELIFVNAHVGWLFSRPGATIQGPERDTPFNIWHTTDGGKTWTNILNSSSPSMHILNGVLAPSVSFGDEHVGLMVGQNNRLYRTSDGGVTWHIQWWPGVISNVAHIGAPQFFTAKDALFTNTTFRLSGLTQGLSIVVYTTHDAGLTWHASSPFSLEPPKDMQGSVNWLGGVPLFVDIQHGWVSASPDSTTARSEPSLVYYRTTDGGQHWTQLPRSSVPNNSVAGFAVSPFSFISPSIGWLADRDSRGGMILLKTVDGGHTWVQIHAHFPSFIQVSSTFSS